MLGLRDGAGRSVAGFGLLLATALGLVATQAAPAARARADLRVASVAVQPVSVSPGGMLRLRAVVRNAGRRRADRSALGFWLSQDPRRGKGDVALGGPVKTKALKRGARRAVKRSVTVPASMQVGAWFALACADVAKKVKERNERNNCRASKATLQVVAAPTQPAPTPTPTLTPTPTSGFLRTPDPLTVSPVTDDARAVTQEVTQFGGTLTATGADGTEYQLVIPQDALLGTQRVTMTPVSSIGGLPLSGGLMGAVELEPHGLQLSHPATLTIDPPGTDPPLTQQSAFVAHAGGEDFHLHPVGPEGTATIRVMHFSSTGIGLGTADDRAYVDAHPGRRPLAQLEQALAEPTRAKRAGEARRQFSPLSGPMMAFYDEVVKPKLQAAETNEALAPDAISHALGWDRQLQLVGLAVGPEYEARNTDLYTRLAKILQHAINETYNRCVVEHSLPAGARLLGWSRQAGLLGFEAMSVDGFEKFTRCARFEVGFDSTVTTRGSIDGDTLDQEHNGSFRVVVSDLMIEFGTGAIPTGTLTHNGSTYSSTIRYAPNQDCQLVTTTTIDSLSTGKLAASIAFDINPFEAPPPPLVEPPRKHKLRLHVQQNPVETYKHQNSGCDDSSSTSTDWKWSHIFADFHQHSAALEIEMDAFEQIGDLIGSAHFTGSRTDGGGTTFTEDTRVELYHRPLP